ncbi:hypothetical protein [Arhodomonas sp. SL1]|uniref:hypothetical protein n=1 Tax=Arhodomonas sp. SL1 TaxID=3425691 RepID=UPI003F882BF4
MPARLPLILAAAMTVASVPTALVAATDSAAGETPAIFSTDYQGGPSVEYRDDPRMQYLSRLLRAVREADAEQRAAMDPLIVTARTFLRTPELYRARALLADGRLVVVDADGATMRTDREGTLSGTVTVPYSIAAAAFRSAVSNAREGFARFLLAHIKVTPVDVQTYTGMMQRPIALVRDLALIEGRYTPVAYGGAREGGGLTLDAEGAPLLTEADLYHLLGGRVSGHVYLSEDLRAAVSGPGADYTVIARVERAEDWYPQMIERGAYTRVGVREHRLPVSQRALSTDPPGAVTGYYEAQDRPVPGSTD